MAKNKGKNKILITGSALIFINLVLLANLFLSKSANSQSFSGSSYCDSIEPTPINLNSIIIPYKIECNKNCERITAGNNLFSYYGRNANIWGTYPYGLEGTFEAGGNIVLENARKFEISNYDGSGKHWIMTDEAEPYGNAIGLTRDGTKTIFGGSLIINGNLNILNSDGSIDLLSNSFVPNSIRRSVVLEHVTDCSDGDPDCNQAQDCRPGLTVWKEKLDKIFFNKFSIFKPKRCGLCGGDEECGAGGTETNYGFKNAGWFTAYGYYRVHNDISLCLKPPTIQEDSELYDDCCFELQYTRNNEFDENFVGFQYSGVAGPVQNIHYVVCPYGTEEWPGFVSCEKLEDCKCTTIEEPVEK